MFCKTSLYTRSVKTLNPVTSSNQIRKEQELWTASEIYVSVLTSEESVSEYMVPDAQETAKSNWHRGCPSILCSKSVVKVQTFSGHPLVEGSDGKEAPEPRLMVEIDAGARSENPFNTHLWAGPEGQEEQQGQSQQDGAIAVKCPANAKQRSAWDHVPWLRD
ncbi:unnamed protein product [Leuciscus chuanchicus]